MADPPPSPGTGELSGARPDRGSKTTGRPRRKRVFTIIAIVLVLLFVIAQAAVGPGPGASGRTASGVHRTSHLDEARGHLRAILHVFD